ncbi:hypothetical protein [Jiulongibacter sediminis]|uniref:hypothetical protein n=1 Tax=Jiulongibacter sediminis TaxID=1605367 RepID=UPI0026F31DD8|nr:hypothetical protein [Jiulongibacter sediminis]
MNTNTENSKPCLPLPRENEGNIVNISNCGCDENNLDKSAPKNYLFYEKETPQKFCCFDIYIIRCWLTHNKDFNPAGGIIIQGYANEQSGVAPGLAGYLHIHPKHGWINLNQKIGSFTVKEGEKFPVLIRVDALEWGEGLDGASDVGSDREPDQRGTQLILDCSSEKVELTELAVKLQRPLGGDAGRIAVEIAAFKSSCCH